MKPVVIDNFIDKQSFQNLQNVMFGGEFCWVYNGAIDYEDDEDKFQFTHIFYNPSNGVNSQYYGILSDILNKIKPKEIFRIKANLLTKTSEIEVNSFHNDIDDLGILPWTTSIFYMNTNNGYTRFKKGGKIKCVENRMVIFPADLEHSGFSCTDEQRKVVVNFNYE